MSDDPPRDQPTGSGADRDPVEVALDAAAAAPVTIGPERLSALEARVMGAVADRDERGAVAALGSVPVRSISGRKRGFSLLSAAAVVIVVAVGALSVALLAGDDDALAIAAADRVVVELPDGEAVAGEAGTELPDGARLEVIGFVEIDGRRFGPGSYRIVDGEVVRSGPGPDDPAADSGTSDGSDASDRPDAADEGSESDEVDDDGSVRTTVAGGARSDDESDNPASDDSRGGTVDDSEDRPVADVEPRPTEPPRTTVPARPPDVARPPAPTTAPVRQAPVPTRPTTTVPSRRPTAPTTTTSTTTPARTTVPDETGETRPSRP